MSNSNPMHNSNNSNSNTREATVSYKPGGSLSVQFGAQNNDPDDLSGSSLSNSYSSGRISFHNGVAVTETLQRSQSSHADTVSNRIATAGDSILATARTSWGSLGQPITGKSIITVGGIDTSVAAAEHMGLVARNAEGNYYETGLTSQKISEQAEQQRQDEALEAQQDEVNFHDDHVAKLDEILEPLPQPVYDATVASAIANGIESLDYDSLADSFGTNKADAMARAQFVMHSFRGQVDSAVAPLVGEDVQAFYDWAAENRPRDHQKAMRSLMFASNLGDFKELAKQYMLYTIPDSTTLKAGKFETKVEQGKEMVKIGGMWLTAASAARAGLI